VVELREGSAMAFALGRGEFAGGSGMLDTSRGKGEKERGFGSAL